MTAATVETVTSLDQLEALPVGTEVTLVSSATDPETWVRNADGLERNATTVRIKNFSGAVKQGMVQAASLRKVPVPDDPAALVAALHRYLERTDEQANTAVYRREVTTELDRLLTEYGATRSKTITVAVHGWGTLRLPPGSAPANKVPEGYEVTGVVLEWDRTVEFTYEGLGSEDIRTLTQSELDGLFDPAMRNNDDFDWEASTVIDLD